jgi:phosphoribosylglycinamide formyltransferase-1
MPERKRVAILISGRGTNMSALIRAAARPDYPAEIVLVLSSRSDAAGVARAAEAGIATAIVSSKEIKDRAEFEAAIDQHLRAARIDIVCLAGFMRLLSEDFVERWRNRVINIHPSILPAFQGLNTHERALAAGVKLHGCTVHFVRAAMDAGPIIAQAAVPVLSTDTPEDLAARVLGAEHRIFPEALALVAAERTRVIGERVVIADLPPEAALGVLTSPAKI